MNDGNTSTEDNKLNPASNQTSGDNNLTNPGGETTQPANNENQSSGQTNQSTEGNTSGDQGGDSGSAGDQGDANKKTPWFQRRIDALTAEKWEERREKENLKRQTEALLTQLAEMRKGNTSSTAANTSATATTPPATQTTPTVTSTPALTEAEIDARANAKADEMVRKKAFDKACNDIAEAGKDEYDDFEKSLRTFQMVGGLPTALLETITEMPNAHKILYNLGKDADLTERVVKMGASRAALELARIEANMSKPVSRAVSSAPAPVKPVDGSSRANEDPEKMSTEEWISWRNKALSEKRK